MPSWPAFLWYPKDCDTDENMRLMDDRELGFYLRCLNHSWLNNGLPTSTDEIARLFGKRKKYVEKIWFRVGKCFSVVNGRLVNEKQERIRLEQAKRSELRTLAAKASWEPTSKRHASADAHADGLHMQTACTSVPTLNTSPFDELDHTPTVDQERDNGESPAKTAGAFVLSGEPDNGTRPDKPDRGAWFDREFWPAVWAKIGKGASRKQFLRVATTGALKDHIVAAARAQGPAILARADATGSAVLHPATWLNQGRYDDEETPVPKQARGETANERLWRGVDTLIAKGDRT